MTSDFRFPISILQQYCPRFYSWFLLLALLVVLTACGDREKAVDRGVREGILLIGNGTEPKSLDPHLVSGVPEGKIIRSLMEGLVVDHPSDALQVEPGVAETWEHNANFTHWTFQLRKDARWSNGDPVRAQDFVYSWKRMLTPELGAEYAEMLYVLEGAEAFHKGEVKDFSSVGVKALDDHTLDVRLSGPTPVFLSMLKHVSFYPVNPRVVEQFGGGGDRQNAWSRLENYVGNGPFRLKKWVTNQIIAVEKNPDYWDADTVRLNGIEFYPVDNVKAEETMFRGGRLHITSTIPSNKIAFFQEKMPDKVRIDPYLGTYFYRFNTTRKPFDDPKVREALALAIDRQLLVDRVTKGGQLPATGYVPQGMAGYPASEVATFDVERARKLLAEAGYPDGKGFPKKEILINTSEGHRYIAEALQAMWREYLGIDVGIYNQEWKVYLDSQNQMNFDMARAGWIADYAYPTTFLDMFTTDNGNNKTGWSDANYDRLIRAARTAQSDEERMRLLQEAEAILLKAMPILPLYWYTNAYLMDPRLQGYEPNILDSHSFKKLWFKAS